MPENSEFSPKSSERLAIKLGTIVTDPEIPQAAKDFIEQLNIPAYFNEGLLSREQAERLLRPPGELNDSQNNEVRLIYREGELV